MGQILYLAKEQLSQYRDDLLHAEPWRYVAYRELTPDETRLLEESRSLIRNPKKVCAQGDSLEDLAGNLLKTSLGITAELKRFALPDGRYEHHHDNRSGRYVFAALSSYELAVVKRLRNAHMRKPAQSACSTTASNMLCAIASGARTDR